MSSEIMNTNISWLVWKYIEGLYSVEFFFNFKYVLIFQNVKYQVH